MREFSGAGPLSQFSAGQGKKSVLVLDDSGFSPQSDSAPHNRYIQHLPNER
jgi:hypothetical protein